MSEKFKCTGCQSTDPSGDFDKCFVCGSTICPRCCRVRKIKSTGQTVRVCGRCLTVQDPRLR